MHGYPVMQVVQYSMPPPCSWGPAPEPLRPSPTGIKFISNFVRFFFLFRSEFLLFNFTLALFSVCALFCVCFQYSHRRCLSHSWHDANWHWPWFFTVCGFEPVKTQQKTFSINLQSFFFSFFFVFFSFITCSASAFRLEKVCRLVFDLRWHLIIARHHVSGCLFSWAIVYEHSCLLRNGADVCARNIGKQKWLSLSYSLCSGIHFNKVVTEWRQNENCQPKAKNVKRRRWSVKKTTLEKKMMTRILHWNFPARVSESIDKCIWRKLLFSTVCGFDVIINAC